jgi:steroid delta-isomerase-like uncharacterized protein
VVAQEAVRKWLDTFNRRDSDAFAEVFAPDAVVYDPFYPEPLKGREAIRKSTEEGFNAFPDMQLEVSNILTGEGRFAADGIITGMHSGSLADPQGIIPPTNRRITLHFAAFARLNPQGLIVEVRRYVDTASFIAQLGLSRLSQGPGLVE